MKCIAWILLLLNSLNGLAADANHVIAVSDWSSPVGLQDSELHEQAIRGRLLLVEGLEPAYGGPRTETHAMTFVELQNVTEAHGGSLEVCFDVMKLKCQSTDQNGKEVPKPTAGSWGGRGPLSPCWVALPYNSTIRLFVNAGPRTPLAVYPNGEPWRHWSISPSDTNAYFLSGTLDIFTRTNDAILSMPQALQKSFYDEHCRGTLTFPKTQISAKKR